MAKHGLKFGGSVRAIRDTQVQATAALYTFPNVAAYLAAKDGLNTRTYASFIQTVGEPSMEYNSLFSGLYAQDTWKPRANITVTYGVRYDVYRPPPMQTKTRPSSILGSFGRTRTISRHGWASQSAMAKRS